MVNTAKFDRDDVIKRALIIFWEKGYHATSTRDIQKAVNMRPGSIYAAFNSKEGLFKEVIARYVKVLLSNIDEISQQHSSYIDQLQAFAQRVVLDDRNMTPSDICLLTKVFSELTENPLLLQEAQQQGQKLQLRYRDILEKAKDNGELKPNQDPLMLARFIQVQLNGLKAYLSATDDVESVSIFIKDIFNSIRKT